MIGPDRLDRVSAEAVVPEQVTAYVRAVAGSKPKLYGACIGYETDGSLVLVGYPLHAPRDAGAMAEAVDLALASPGLQRLTVIGPARPPQAPERVAVATDGYYALSVPGPAPGPGPKLRNLLHRAEREVALVRGERFVDGHAALVQRYLDERSFPAGTRRIFQQLPRYVEESPGALLVSARRADGRLAAFAVGEFASLSTAFFMFCFRDPGLAPPGSADLVFSGLLQEARERGQTRMNLGLGISEGIRFFKRKWGAEPFLPYVEVSWKPASPGIFSRLSALLQRKAQ
ncbi:MAG: GNAT family N-acetyltransferase [Desulfobacteraceae bacterium]|nr:GNAT family N-acetyltransferase [Desulfobacteraceae bacterium]